MPPDAIIWLVGTLSVAAMGGISTVSVAMIRRSNNGLVTKGDIEAVKSRLNEIYEQLDERLRYLERR